MRDIVGNLAHRAHQPLDLVEHAVEIGGELVEFVVGPAARHAVRQIAGDHPLGGAVHLLDPAQHVAAHHRPAQEPDAERNEARPQERRLDAIAKRGPIADIAPHEEAIAPGDRKQHAARRVGLAPALLPHIDLERQGSGADRHAVRPAADVAGERFSVAVGHQVEHAVAAVAGAAGRDDLDETAEAPLGVLFGEAGDLGVEGRLGLPLDKVGARPIDEKQDADDRDREHEKIEAGQPKRVRPHQAPCRPEDRARPVPADRDRQRRGHPAFGRHCS